MTRPSCADGDFLFALEVIRVLVEVVLVVGRVLARRRFSASAEHARPVLIVGIAFRGDGDR